MIALPFEALFAARDALFGPIPVIRLSEASPFSYN
jgi:hypothetical protein